MVHPAYKELVPCPYKQVLSSSTVTVHWFTTQPYYEGCFVWETLSLAILFYPEYFIALPVLLFLRFCYKARKAEASFFLFFFENTFASFFLSNCWIVIFWTAIRVIRLECWYLWFFFCRDCLSKLFNSLLYLSCLHFSLVLTRKSWRNEYSWSWNR